VDNKGEKGERQNLEKVPKGSHGAVQRVAPRQRCYIRRLDDRRVIREGRRPRRGRGRRLAGKEKPGKVPPSLGEEVRKKETNRKARAKEKAFRGEGEYSCSDGESKGGTDREPKTIGVDRKLAGKRKRRSRIRGESSEREQHEAESPRRPLENVPHRTQERSNM